MAIVYEKLIRKLKEKNVTYYTLKKKGSAINQATFAGILGRKNITMKTLDRLCELLDCQPGDLIEYVPDQEGGKTDD